MLPKLDDPLLVVVSVSSIATTIHSLDAHAGYVSECGELQIKSQKFSSPNSTSKRFLP